MRSKLSAMLAVAVLLLSASHAVMAQRRSMDQVREIVAKSPVGYAFGSSKSKMFGSLQSQEPTGSEPYYIFNAGEGRGFVIVSGDERMTPVLAYGTKSDFDPDNVPDNVKAWLELYSKEYDGLDAKSKSPSVAKVGTVPGASGYVAPFLGSVWGQTAPYNNLCPEYTTGSRSATGCGATAMAQCLYYYKYPSVGKGTNSYITRTHGFNESWNFSSHPLQWNLMKNSYSATGNTAEEETAIAELLYACGVAVDMDYDKESGSYHKDVMEGLYKYYDYDADMALVQRNDMSEEAWDAAMTAELDAHRPVITAAWTSGGAGHFFIVHGYRVESGVTSYYINWGWRGNYDGYFVMPNLCYDGNEANSLSNNISSIIGIKPDNGISDDAYMLTMRSILPSTTDIDLSVSSTINIDLQVVSCTSRRSFSGDLHVYLEDANGHRTLLADINNRSISSSYSANVRINSVAVPPTLESGSYSLVCYANRSGGNQVRVPLKTPATLTVKNDAADFKPQLAASAVEIGKTGDRAMTLDATNVMNAGTTVFNGTMQMLITDNTDHYITTFGSTFDLNNLAQYNYYNRTDRYSGTLPDDIHDGAYRLWLGAQQNNYTGWGKVKKYTIEDGYITALDLDGGTPFWVVNNKVTLTAPTAQITYYIDGEVFSQETLTMGDAITPPTPPDRDGYTFTGWNQVPETMPATDVEVHGTYSANKYLVRFVADGTLVSESRLEYGSAITPPEGPAKTGYTFAGWGEMPATVPAHDVEYTAQYTVNQYKIIYYVDSVIYKEDVFDYKSAVTMQPAPEKEGHTFSGWDRTLTTMPARDVEVNGKFTVNKYTVTFRADGHLVRRVYLAYGSPIEIPDAPNKTGYTFVTWGDVPATVPAMNTEFIGQYQINQYKVTYLVDGETYKEDIYDYGAEVTMQPAPDDREGCTFSGWNKTLATMPAKDVEVSGSFTPNKYTATFIVDGEVYKTQSVTYGKPITPPAGPSKTGRTFVSWGDIPETAPAHNVEFTAQYTLNKYKITYLVDSIFYKEEVYDYGTEVTMLAAPEREGHTFGGWSKTLTTMPAKDVEINGNFTINRYSVTFRADGHLISRVYLAYGSPIEIPDAPNKTGYTFVTWGDVPATVPAMNTEFIGQYQINQYKVTYLVDGETYKEDIYDYGAEVTMQPAPDDREGCTFSGWNKTLATMPAKDVEVSGSFTPNKYTATFIVDGEVYKTQSVTYGKPITPPAGPSKTGRTFVSWGDIPETAPAHDVEFTAQYSTNLYTITYLVDGETFAEQAYEYGAAITAPTEIPEKEGHTFNIWKYLPETMPAKDLSINATFTVNKYEVRFVAMGSLVKKSTLSYGAAITIPDAPAKTGYTFVTWGDVPATVPAMNVEYSAQYTPNQYRVTYLVDGETYMVDIVDYNTEVVMQPEPEKEGHTFSGWNKTLTTMPAKDVEVSGTFTVNSYTLTYLIDGKPYKTYTVKYGAEIIPEGNPEDEDYYYAWEDIPATMPARDVEVNAYITGIAGFVANNPDVQIYTIDGKRLRALQKGVNIVRTADGKTRKVIVR